MKFLEFYFNPKGREHTTYGSFCYKPATSEEKKLGYLGIAGELANILPPNEKLLGEIAETIKNAYYSTNQTVQQATEKALEAANTLLDSLRKKGNVSWLGNLHLALFAVAGEELYFTKTGTLKFLLARDGELLDIGKHLEASQAINPMRSFSHVVMGKVSRGDYLFCITKDVFRFFEATGILQQLAYLQGGKEEKTIKTLLKQHEKQFKDYSGLVLLALVEKIEQPSAPARKISLPQIPPIIPRISAKQRGGSLKKILPRAPKLPRISMGRMSKVRIRLPLHIPVLTLSDGGRKKFFLVASFIIVVLLGSALAQFQKKMAVHIAEEKLLQVQQKIWSAESKLLAGNQNEANLLFQEALRALELLGDTSLRNRKEKLEKEVMDRLEQINKIEVVAAEPVFSANSDPKKILRLGDTFYLANPASQEMESWNSVTKETQLLPIPWPFDIVKEFQNSLLFYEKEDTRLVVQDGVEVKLFPPRADFSPIDVAPFRQSLYFLDTTTGIIVKYAFLPNIKELIPEVWTNSPGDAKLRKGVSLAVDGSIWVLAKDGAVHRYWGGTWQETLELALWPKLAGPTKIFTANQLPYIYILDPPEKRLVILNKRGDPVKQYTNPTFAQLKDLAVSDDGKMLYVLNGKDLYQIEVEE